MNKLRSRVKQLVSELTEDYDQVEEHHIDMIVDLLYDDDILLFPDKTIQDEVIHFFKIC